MPASLSTGDTNLQESTNNSSDTDLHTTVPSTPQHEIISQDSSLNISTSSIPSLRSTFQNDGFLLFHNAIHPTFISHLQTRLEHVLRGRFDRGVPPDKMPKILIDNYLQNQYSSNGSTKYSPLGFHPHNSKKKVIQIINMHKCDGAFRELATCAEIGRMVGILSGWQSVRLAQDQVWAKPPGAPPLVFHRDSPYFMFTPESVITVWIALDDMEPTLGPLEYVKSSHKWGTGRIGSSSTFFQSDNGKNLLYSAAHREGIQDPETALEIISTAGMNAGGMSIHDGKTWHGSGKNCSVDRPRRGLGLHFVPGNVRFTSEARKSKLWGRYIPEGCDEVGLSEMELEEVDFPLVWKAQDLQIK